MTEKDPEWYLRLVDNVADLDAKRGEPKRRVALTPDQRTLLLAAARDRGMSETAYMRRAIMAFVCHDLGLEWSTVMASEGPIRHAGHAAVYDRTPARGRGFGEWTIERLR